MLKHHSQAPSFRWNEEIGGAFEDHLAGNLDPAAIRLGEAGKATQQRRLAAAAWSEQANELARLYDQIDRVEDFQRVETFLKPRDDDAFSDIALGSRGVMHHAAVLS
ncbi:hypothetical protein J2T08_005644 [Neorhizobium galegae]|nr:hypothetical protein [Neorhizobium galegae]